MAADAHRFFLGEIEALAEHAEEFLMHFSSTSRYTSLAKVLFFTSPSISFSRSGVKSSSMSSSLSRITRNKENPWILYPLKKTFTYSRMMSSTRTKRYSFFLDGNADDARDIFGDRNDGEKTACPTLDMNGKGHGF